MSAATIYTCDGCRKTIEPESVLMSNPARDEVAYSREMLTVDRTFLVGMVVNESTRYTFHFCSRACLGKWAT